MKCLEVVIYEVKPNKDREFLEVYGWIRKEMGMLPGFVSAETLQSLDQNHMYADLWVWESAGHAASAHAKYASLPHAREFQGVIEKVIHSGHYVPFL